MKLYITHGIIRKKIKKMKENESPGVDWVSQKLPKEIIGQSSTPLAKVFNLPLKEGIVPSDLEDDISSKVQTITSVNCSLARRSLLVDTRILIPHVIIR